MRLGLGNRELRRAVWGNSPRPSVNIWLTLLLVAVLATTGCALHYSNSKTGKETSIGVSQVTLAFEDLGNGWVKVSSGARFPGLVMGLGPDFFGLSLGYTVRERLTVVRSNELDRFVAQINGRSTRYGQADAGDLNRRLTIGLSQVTRPGGSRTVLVTGKAIAGLAASVDGGSPRVHAGLHNVLLTTLAPDSDVFFEFSGGTNAWPHFDFTEMETRFSGATDSTPQPEQP